MFATQIKQGVIGGIAKNSVSSLVSGLAYGSLW